MSQALKEKKLFILEYHDLFPPFVHKVRQLENTMLYASRTVFFLTPIIIAANRQLSAMHLIFRLLLPHFRYTVEANAIAREYLINAGGIIETCLISLKKHSVELSSVAYGQQWRFDVEDPTAEIGLRLTIKDYPCAADGLLVWSVDYVSYYYSDGDAAVAGDHELQAWWSEVRNGRHENKKKQPWWPELDSPESLVGVLKTIIWIVSGLHAAVGFGRYHYAGSNRHTIARFKLPVKERLNRFWTKAGSVPLESIPSLMKATLMPVQPLAGRGVSRRGCRAVLGG